MNNIIYALIILAIIAGCKSSETSTLKSPDKRIQLSVFLDEGKPKYMVRVSDQVVLDSSALGISMEDENLFSGLQLATISSENEIDESYSMNYGKLSGAKYRATERVWSFKNAKGSQMNIRFRVSNDGVAFRYEFPGSGDKPKIVNEEHTGFRFIEGTTGFLQQMSVAKTGWSKVHPSYEEYYEKDVPVGTPSPSPAGWVFPALFHSGDNWIAITESSLEKNYCGTRLRANAVNREYLIGFPDSVEVFPSGRHLPYATLPFETPWRVVAIGSLKTVVESDLGNAVAKEAAFEAPYAKPGHSSWSWALLKDDSTTFEVQKKFIDHAANMRWEYCLVDADWDRKIGYDKMKELAKYAQSKNIGLLLWYNSAGDWNETPYTPKNKLLTYEDREREFAMLESVGIRGVKVDFFGGDGQSMIEYYIDILEHAAKHKLMVNFHGSTIPRGWHRTYPNLMNMEAVKGFEFVTFAQECADAAPSHCTILPFTRNLFDPMDFTPLSLDSVPGIIQRTSPGFELALSVVFTAGITHFVETPRGLKNAPKEVQDFLRDVPATWDETKYLLGYPGKDVVMARRSGSKWYIAGINGEGHEKQLTVDLSFLESPAGWLITDASEAKRKLSAQQINNPSQNIKLTPFGGFVMVVE